MPQDGVIIIAFSTRQLSDAKDVDVGGAADPPVRLIAAESDSAAAAALLLTTSYASGQPRLV